MELSLVSTEIRQNLMPLQPRSAALFFVCFCWLLELENYSIKQPVLTLFSFRGVVLKKPLQNWSSLTIVDLYTGEYLYVKNVPINFHYKGLLTVYLFSSAIALSARMCAFCRHIPDVTNNYKLCNILSPGGCNRNVAHLRPHNLHFIFAQSIQLINKRIVFFCL